MRRLTPTIVVAGSVAQKPRHGGHTWVFLQYVLGLQRLGWEVLFLDRLEPEMCVDDAGRPCPAQLSLNVHYFRDLMERFGLGGDYALFAGGEDGGEVHGLDRRQVLARVRDAELLLNIMGFLDDEEVLASARRRVFLDIDPGFGQMWRALGWTDVFAGHDDFVTVGLNVGRADCTIPDCGLDWVTTPQPILLERWPAAPPAAGRWTSVGAWRGPYAAVDYDGLTYGLRAHAFRDIVELPRLVEAELEIALDIDAADRADVSLLENNGWRLVDPRQAAGDPWRYRQYIARSAGELMVAKDMYVRSKSGWFSDRSICYLASGRPVVALDTGLAGNLPLGEGLLTFRTVEEARAAIVEVSSDPLRHSRAARRIAEECFDSDRVLGRLLDRLGVEGPLTGVDDRLPDRRGVVRP